MKFKLGYFERSTIYAGHKMVNYTFVRFSSADHNINNLGKISVTLRFYVWFKINQI